MRILTTISLFIFFSCTDLFYQENQEFKSINLNGGAWVDIDNQYSCDLGLRVMDKPFSFEIFFSGKGSLDDDAATLFSIIGKNQNDFIDLDCDLELDGNEEIIGNENSPDYITLGAFRNPTFNNQLDIYINNAKYPVTVNGMDLSNQENFHHLAISASGPYIDPGQGTLLELSGTPSEECISNFVFYSPSRELLSAGFPEETEEGSGVFECDDELNICISIDDNSLEYLSSSKISDFSFEHDGCITNASGGDAEANGLTLSYSSTIITATVESNNEVTIYIDGEAKGVIDESIKIQDSNLILGAIANEEQSILSNFWYGYIDEVRLWSRALSANEILFNKNNPTKVVSNLANGDICSLKGLWRFNYQSAQTSIPDERCYGEESLYESPCGTSSQCSNTNDGIIYTLPGYSIEYSSSGY